MDELTPLDIQRNMGPMVSLIWIYIKKALHIELVQVNNTNGLDVDMHIPT